MKAQVFIRPLANAAGDYQDERRVDGDLVSRLKISQRLMKNKWKYGLLYPAMDALEFDNSSRAYDPATSGRSIFAAAGADRAEVRIAYPMNVFIGNQGNYTAPATIYRGQISSLKSSHSRTSGRATWQARTPDIAIVSARLNAGLITAGMSVRQAIEACFGQSEIAAALPSPGFFDYFDPVPGGAIINNEEALLGEDRAADKVLQKLLMAGDNILVNIPYENASQVRRRGYYEGGFLGSLGAGRLTKPLRILRFEDGIEGIYNQIICQTGRTGQDATLIEEDAGSISTWGRRPLELDLRWSADLDHVSRIARNLLARLGTPQQTLEVLVPLVEEVYQGSFDETPAGSGPYANVGAYVDVDIPALGPRGAARYRRGARYGAARYSSAAYPAIEGGFYIEEIYRDLQSDTAKMVLRRTIPGTGDGN